MKYIQLQAEKDYGTSEDSAEREEVSNGRYWVVLREWGGIEKYPKYITTKKHKEIQHKGHEEVSIKLSN